MNSIEINFVPYQIAIDMKSIGFDEPCFGFYDEFSNNKVIVGYSDGINKAPTFSQAFRWFRENHKMNHLTFLNIYLENGNYSYEKSEELCLIKLINTFKKKIK